MTGYDEMKDNADMPHLPMAAFRVLGVPFFVLAILLTCSWAVQSSSAESPSFDDTTHIAATTIE